MERSLLLIQLTVILVGCRALAWTVRWLDQPPVIGEMLLGLLVSPLLLGRIAPDLQVELFPAKSLAVLSGIGNLGIVIFVAAIGAEIRTSGAGRQWRGATYVATCSLVLPLALGTSLAIFLYGAYAPSGGAFLPFVAFLAVSVSVTALPVMARILKDRGYLHTAAGRLSLSAAVLADVAAWFLLAIVVAAAGAGKGLAAVRDTVLGLLLIAAFALGVVRPAWKHLARRFPGTDSGALIPFFIIGAIGSAVITDHFNLHAVFGAFVFGLCLPGDRERIERLVGQVQQVVVPLLLPVFFVVSGLATTASSLDYGSVLTIALVLIVATVGKVGGGFAGARLSGEGWRNSLAVGVLMNTRGMMELIVIKIGLDIGIIDHRMFTLLLIMALITTMATPPALSVLLGKTARNTGVDTAREPGGRASEK